MANSYAQLPEPKPSPCPVRPEAVEAIRQMHAKKCPSCHFPMTLDVGVIEEPHVTRFMQIVRRSRPAVFWSCWHCEHCEEVS